MIGVNNPNIKLDFHCYDREESMEITELMAAATLDVDMETTETSGSSGNSSDSGSDNIDDEFLILMTDHIKESVSRGATLRSDFSQLTISTSDQKDKHSVVFNVLRNYSSDSRSSSESTPIVKKVKSSPKKSEEFTGFTKRPLNPYMEWTTRKRQELTIRYPGKNAKEISIELGKIWRRMDFAVKKRLREDYQRRLKLLKQQGAKFKPYNPVGQKMKKEKLPVNNVNEETQIEIDETNKDEPPQQKEETEKPPEQDDHLAEFRINLIEEYHSYMNEMRQLFGY